MVAVTNPYSSSGGKGGSMAGFAGAQPDMGMGMYGGSKGGQSGGTGLGGVDMAQGSIGGPPSMALPDATPPAVAQPAAPAPAAPQGPNAFEQGLGAQNNAMDFFQSQMMGGNQGIMDMIANMGRGSGGGVPMVVGGGGPAQYNIDSIARDLYDYDPTMADAATYQAAQLSDADINQYMNPYTQNVIDASMADLDKARLSALNTTGAAASRGGAFGGDRHGIMEAQNNADYLSQVASTSAQLRNQGYQNAQNAAMSDINALNQQRGTNAAMAQQAAMANAQAANERSQFVGSTAAQAEMQKQQIEAQMAAMGGGGNGGGTAVQMAQLRSQERQAALQAAMAMQGMQFDAANQLYGMGGDRYGMGQDALNSMGQVGNKVDGINQQLIDQQMGMFMNQQNAPHQQYQQMLGALGSLSGGGTQSYNPGVFDYLKAGTSMFGLGK